MMTERQKIFATVVMMVAGIIIGVSSILLFWS